MSWSDHPIVAGSSSLYDSDPQLQFGSTSSPVVVLPDASFSFPPHKSILERLKHQLRTSNINGIGLWIQPLSRTQIGGFVEWLREVVPGSGRSDNTSDRRKDNTAITWTELPPGTYPLEWPRQRRDITITEQTGPCKLGIINSVSFQHPLVRSFNTFVQLLFARLWDDPNVTNNDFQYAAADVQSSGSFLIILNPTIGHRDFIRVIKASQGGVFTHKASSLFVDVAAVTEFNSRTTTKDKKRGNVAPDSSVPWFPWPESQTTIYTSYLVLPAQMGEGNNAIGQVEDKSHMNGVYVTCTTDYRQRKANKGGDQLYYEYVMPNSDAEQGKVRQFFVPLYAAICLPAFVAVRFSSHAKYKTCVVAMVHSFRNSDMFDEAGELENRKRRNMVTLNTGVYPFNDSFLRSVSDDHVTSILHRSDICRRNVNTATTNNNFPMHVGTIPVFKTIQAPMLRHEIIKDLEEQRHRFPHKWGQENMGHVSVIWNAPTFPGVDRDIYCYLSFTSGKKCLSVDDVPVKEILKFLNENADIDLCHFTPTDLQNFSPRRRPCIESDSE